MKTRIFCLFALSMLLAACDSGTDQAVETPEGEEPAAAEDMPLVEETATPPAEAEPNIVEYTIKGLQFFGPKEIPRGWTTFRINNESPMVHVAIIERFPEGKTVADQQEMVAPIFQEGMDLLIKGDQEGANQKFGELPAWFGDIVFYGGPGLIAPTGIAQATVNLEPGTYVLECYVKTGGVFHSYNPEEGAYGMVYQFTVTNEPSGAPEPDASLEMTVSAENGIEITDDIKPGQHTIRVTFADQQPHENFVGHDVHLAWLEDDTDLEALETWMDWRVRKGLQTPAPAEFLGGLNEMPAGETGYFTVPLHAGRYAWIAEVPNANEKGMLKVFTVAEEAGTGE